MESAQQSRLGKGIKEVASGLGIQLHFLDGTRSRVTLVRRKRFVRSHTLNVPITGQILYKLQILNV